MKKYLIKVLFSVLITNIGANVFAQGSKSQPKPVVMILGTYHFANPGRDLNNAAADDVRSAKRQKEVTNFVVALKKFRPTKIAVEMPNQKHLEHYTEYLNGRYELSSNEVDQIGFRLAKEMNLKQVVSVDWQGNFDFDKVLASAKANKQEAAPQVMLDFGKTESARFDKMQKTATITELLRDINTDQAAQAMHQPYLALLRVGAEQDYAGADLVRDWYERNLKIYANIARIVESNDERILVVIGAGHTKLLRQFITEAGDFNLEVLNKYL